MATKARHEGYLLIDHTNSPGAGILSGGVRHEFATVTCCHCSTVVVLNPMRTRERNYCAKCDHYVCDNPGCNASCNPIAKLFDETQTQLERNLLSY